MKVEICRVKQSKRNKPVKIGRVIWLSGFLLYQCRSQRPLTSWGNLTWKQTKCKLWVVHKNGLILPVLFVYVEKLRFVFTLDFTRTLLWQKIGDEGCWSPLFLSLLSLVLVFFSPCVHMLNYEIVCSLVMTLIKLCCFTFNAYMRLVPVKFDCEFKLEQLIVWLKSVLECDVLIF